MRATTCPPGIANAAVEETFGHYEALVRGTTDYYRVVMSRCATPLDVGLDLVSWTTTVLSREAPRWATKNRVVAEWPIARLRDFSRSRAAAGVPTLLLPPQAGRAISNFGGEQAGWGPLEVTNYGFDIRIHNFARTLPRNPCP